MRGAFALVLCAGVAAAVAVTLWSSPGDGTGGATEKISNNGDERLETHDVQDQDSLPQPKRGAAPGPTLAARIERLLSEGNATTAAKQLLRAETRALSDAGVRSAALRTAAALEAEAVGQGGRTATKAKLEARKLYAAVYDEEAASTEQSERAYRACRELNRVLVFGNGAPAELVYRHRLAAGDRVWKLARGEWRLKGVTASPGFVLYVNGISDPRRMPATGTLRVPLEPVSLLIRKSRFELTVLLGGVPVERFAVGLGADQSTPVGTFTVKSRIKNPDWYFQGRRIPFGHPDHLIGTRWMGFEGAVEADGIGIHGTNDSSSVGKAVSLGCVRMRDVEVERLFEWVSVGTQVELRD